MLAIIGFIIVILGIIKFSDKKAFNSIVQRIIGCGLVILCGVLIIIVELSVPIHWID